MAARPEDFDAEEPEVAEYDAVRGRQQIGDLEDAFHVAMECGRTGHVLTPVRPP